MTYRALTILSCALSLMAANITFAGITFVPHPGFATPPHYWSGTNCRAHYYAEVNGGTLHIEEAWMTINGEEVWHIGPVIPPTPRGPFLSDISPKVI